MSYFSSKLRELRKESGLTQKKLAQLLNVTDDSIYSWEKERAEPSINMIIQISKVFNISVDELIGADNS